MDREFTQTLWIDFETRSQSDLKAVGAHKYCMDSTTEILLVAYAFGDEGEKASTLDELPPEVWNALEDRHVLKIAHNAEFDMCVCKYVMGLNISYDQWFDTAYQAAYFSLPRALKNLADVLGTTKKASQEELHLFSMPIKPKLKRETSEANKEYNRRELAKPPVFNQPDDFPIEWARFKKYATGDVATMRECAKKMQALPDIEIDAMQLTFIMNFNGVPFDGCLADKILGLSHEYEIRASEEARREYGIVNLRSTQQVQAALQKCGVFLPTLNAKERGSVSHPILELRDQATGAAFRKLPKAKDRVCLDGRIHGEFVGYGAHTGRWSSRGVQLQNWYRIMSEVNETLGNIESYEHLKQHLRLCLGKDPHLMFTCADLSQIEARIVAYLAGCKWLMEVFATGGDPYSSTALKMFGGEIDPVTGKHPKRQHGKAAVLGFGYGGSGLAIERIDKRFYDEIGAEAAQELCYTYRNAHPEITALWYKLDKAWKEAMRVGTCKVMCYKVRISFTFDGKTMRITLPSGRALYYRNVRTTPSKYGFDVAYAEYGDGHLRWQKIWHGVIIENIVQAIARDILVEAMVRACVREPEAQLIMSVHDEVGFLHTPTTPMLETVLEEMAHPIVWMPELITKGDGFTSDRYRK